MADGQSGYLRNNMTLPEVLIWTRLQKRQIGYLINRQFSIGPYITDFCCRKLKVVIEIDGKIHELKRGADEERDRRLAEEGYYVYRIPAKRVLRDPDRVAQEIKDFLDRICQSQATE